jgi:hypothetical protein
MERDFESGLPLFQAYKSYSPTQKIFGNRHKEIRGAHDIQANITPARLFWLDRGIKA